MLHTFDTIPIIDSEMTLKDALDGTNAPDEIIDSLCLIDVRHWAFDSKLHRGQLIVHRGIVQDIVEIFELIEQLKFPVARVVPIVKYRWSDDMSMADNNSSAFNYRFVLGTERLSHHAYGRAVDINPCLNPVIYENGHIDPAGTIYNPERPGTFSEDHPIVKEFLQKGWRWGGYFRAPLDYHHFDRPL
jgi:peptidoglycan L-alanyl-D-glutamate endopeptidase CwlK